jgi:hypothetical protein
MSALMKIFSGKNKLVLGFNSGGGSERRLQLSITLASSRLNQ